MTLQNKGTYADKLQIYIPPLKKDIVNKTKELLEREGSSLSQFLLAAIEEYYRLHEPGNPQQRLDTIVELGHAYRVNNCSICGAVPYARVNNGQKTYFLCRPHFEHNKKRLTSYKIL
jgi:hypothetical protein